MPHPPRGTKTCTVHVTGSPLLPIWEQRNDTCVQAGGMAGVTPVR